MFGNFGRRPAANTTALYDLLGVSKDASETDIKKAFRKLAMIHHPDKGGDPEKFTEIQKAYEILSNPDKRSLYDEGGEDAVDQGDSGMGGMGGMDGMDIFDLFGGGGRRRPQGKQRGENTSFPLQISLEELYAGCNKKLRITRNVICGDCNGLGGKNIETCFDCKGQGVRVVVRQVGPGMVSQSQVTCPKCKGVGKSCKPQDICVRCTGRMTVKESKEVDVNVPRGSRDGLVVTFRGLADHEPGKTPGDVKVTVSVKPHNRFKPEGDHLLMEKTISLADSLTGFSFNVSHLDGHIVHVVHDPKLHGCLQTGQYIRVHDEGLPITGGVNYGCLLIKINVQYPPATWFTAANVAALAKILPSAAAPVACPADVESHCVAPSSAADIQRLIEAGKQQQRRAMRDEDEYEEEGHHHHGGGGGASCQQM